jgi:DNA-binding beta-propeller fold protein YncE
VGSLPDMVTFSPDGKYIMTANEGEPSSDYTVDPNGSISIIDVTNNYSNNIDFNSFSSQLNLTARIERKVGATFAADVEPEYITISSDSKTVWVTLQENNGVAKVDLAKTTTKIFPLGYKDYNKAENTIDVSDKDNTVVLIHGK